MDSKPLKAVSNWSRFSPNVYYRYLALRLDDGSIALTDIA
jgi:hypothetical protein